MRILVLAPQPFYQNRGTPIAVRLLLEVLAGEGHQLEVLTYHEGQDLAIPGVTIHRIPALPGVRNIRPGPSWQKIPCDLAMLKKAFALARGGRFDLVHAVEEGVFVAAALKRWQGLPYVYDMDSSLAQQVVEKFPSLGMISRPLAWCEKKAVCGSLAVLAVCRALEDVVCAYDPDKPVLCLEDISLLGWGEETGAPPPAPLDLPPGPVIMYVGNLEVYQGLDLLLESFALVHAQRPDAQLAVIGGEPGDVAKYQAQAQALGLSEAAHMVGPRPPSQLGFFLAQAQVLVSPRLKGRNTPMKVYSYLDSGRPLLATRLFTHTQVLDDAIALLVEPTAKDMAQGLIRLLDDDALRERLAGAARERVAARHSLSAYRAKLVEYYRLLELMLG